MISFKKVLLRAISFSGTLFAAEAPQDFRWAAAMRSFDHLEQLIVDKKLPVDMRDMDGQTALITAVRKDCYKSIEFLLDKGADVNGITRSGLTSYTPLLQALSYFCLNWDAVRMLLKYGADVALRPDGSWAALEACIVRPDVYPSHIVCLLLEYGADVNMHVFPGDSHLDACVLQEILDMIEHYKQPPFSVVPHPLQYAQEDFYLLLEFGADIPPTIQEKVYSQAAQRPLLAYLIEHTPQTLDLKALVPFHRVIAVRNVMLRYAATRGDIEMVKALLSAGASPLARDDESKSTLEVMQYLAYEARPLKQQKYRGIYTLLCVQSASLLTTPTLGLFEGDALPLPSDVVQYMMQFGVGTEIVSISRLIPPVNMPTDLQRQSASCEVM